MKPSEIIRHGKGELLERGLARGTMLHRDGSVCSLGAIALSRYSEDQVCSEDFRLFVEDDLLVDAARFLSRGYGHSVCGYGDLIDSVWRSNDYAESFDEVMDAFDKAEKLAEQAENA